MGLSNDGNPCWFCDEPTSEKAPRDPINTQMLAESELLGTWIGSGPLCEGCLAIMRERDGESIPNIA